MTSAGGSNEGQPSRAVARITLGPGWGWSRHLLDGCTVSIKGYLFDGPRTLEGESAARHAAGLLRTARTDAEIEVALSRLGGHFALVAEEPNRVVASVDRVRTSPLTYAISGLESYIDDRARRLRDTLGLGVSHLDHRQVLAAAMSGYTIGGATLYQGIKDLRAGEALIIDGSGQRTLRWFIYDAWRTAPMANPEKALSELHAFLIERLAKSAYGRPICVPLSAGYDSRFVAAGLKAAGARDVRLFSYGRAGNHEAETARHIAERLGYPWRFVPFTTRSQAAMFADPAHEAALWETADGCTAVPFEQDWTAIKVLLRDGYIPPNAIIVNGNSGDYITGNHAPKELLDAPAGETAEQRRRRAVAACIKKHFRLWRFLSTPANDAAVSNLLAHELRSAGAACGEEEALFGVHEMLEYQDRQSKYVVSGQRTYEALGLSWRLPLWDDELVLYWRRAEGSLKREQNLYRRVLERDNWGGVFGSIPVNRKTITPPWIRPIRLAAKAACAPMGADAWHDVERRYFQWIMDPLRGTAVVPYLRAASDRRGARHGVSWLAERWLTRHGVDIDRLDIHRAAA